MPGWVQIPYVLESTDLSTVWLSLDGDRQAPGTWRRAYRDTSAAGVQVVKVRGEDRGQHVWLHDGNRPRRVR